MTAPSSSLPLPSLVQEAETLLAADKYYEAVKSYTFLISNEPKNVLLYVRRANAFLKAGDSARGLEDSLMAISLDDRCAQGYVMAALCYRKERNFKDALRNLERAAVLEPRNTETLLLLEATRTDGTPFVRSSPSLPRPPAVPPSPSPRPPARSSVLQSQTTTLRAAHTDQRRTTVSGILSLSLPWATTILIIALYASQDVQMTDVCIITFSLVTSTLSLWDTDPVTGSPYIALSLPRVVSPAVVYVLLALYLGASLGRQEIAPLLILCMSATGPAGSLLALTMGYLWCLSPLMSANPSKRADSLTRGIVCIFSAAAELWRRRPRVGRVTSEWVILCCTIVCGIFLLSHVLLLVYVT